jgi:multidrug efflux pump
VGVVVDGAENTQIGRLGRAAPPRPTRQPRAERPAIMLNVQQAAGRQRDRARSTASRSSCPSCRPRFRRRLKWNVLSDRTTGIRASVSHVEFELCWRWCWWWLVIFVFLRNVRATLIPA